MTDGDDPTATPPAPISSFVSTAGERRMAKSSDGRTAAHVPPTAAVASAAPAAVGAAARLRG